MATMPFFKFDAAAWLTGKVQLLTPAEKGIFIDLLARMWHENGRLRLDGILHRQLHCDKQNLTDALRVYQELGIMNVDGDVLSVKFMLAQIEERQQFVEKKRLAGSLGGKHRQAKQKAESISREQKADTPPDGGDTPGADAPVREAVPAPTPAFDPSKYPQSVEEVLQIAEDPRCAVQITREQAERYFLTRDTADWVDAARRRISPGKVYGDLRKWALNDNGRGKAAASDAVPEVTLPESAWRE